MLFCSTIYVTHSNSLQLCDDWLTNQPTNRLAAFAANPRQQHPNNHDFAHSSLRPAECATFFTGGVLPAPGASFTLLLGVLPAPPTARGAQTADCSLTLSPTAPVLAAGAGARGQGAQGGTEWFRLVSSQRAWWVQQQKLVPSHTAAKTAVTLNN